MEPILGKGGGRDGNTPLKGFRRGRHSLGVSRYARINPILTSEVERSASRVMTLRGDDRRKQKVKYECRKKDNSL